MSSSLFDDETMGDLEADGRVGPAVVVRCEAAPDDLFAIRRLNPAKSPEARVAVAIAENGDSDSSLCVVFTPAVARAVAAAILNAADDADGTTPLAFLPASVRDEEDPTR